MSLAAFHKGDERHNEFSIHVRTEGGWVVSGDIVESVALRKLNYNLSSRFRDILLSLSWHCCSLLLTSLLAMFVRN